MKRLLVGLLTSLAVSPLAAFAAITQTTAPNPDILPVLENITNWAFTLLMAVAGLFLIFAAFNFVTAAGDPEKVKSARDYVLYALIGVIVALLARGLVRLMATITGVTI